MGNVEVFPQPDLLIAAEADVGEGPVIDPPHRAALLGRHPRRPALRERPRCRKPTRRDAGDDRGRSGAAPARRRLRGGGRGRPRLLERRAADGRRPRPPRTTPPHERRQVRLARTPVGRQHAHGVRPRRRRPAPLGRPLAQRHRGHRIHPPERAGMERAGHDHVPDRQHDQHRPRGALRRRRRPASANSPRSAGSTPDSPTASPSTSTARSGSPSGAAPRSTATTAPATSPGRCRCPSPSRPAAPSATTARSTSPPPATASPPRTSTPTARRIGLRARDHHPRRRDPRILESLRALYGLNPVPMGGEPEVSPVAIVADDRRAWPAEGGA